MTVGYWRNIGRLGGFTEVCDLAIKGNLRLRLLLEQRPVSDWTPVTHVVAVEGHLDAQDVVFSDVTIATDACELALAGYLDLPIAKLDFGSRSSALRGSITVQFGPDGIIPPHNEIYLYHQGLEEAGMLVSSEKIEDTGLLLKTTYSDIVRL